MIRFHLDIVESVLAGSMPNSCNGAARLPFNAGLAYLLHVLWPVNLALFKPSPHVLEPTRVGQSSERRCGQTCGPCGLDRGPLFLYSWPLSPNAKLSPGRGPCNPAKAAIEQWKHRGAVALKTRIFAQVKSFHEKAGASQVCFSSPFR